jgi:hypothetical protein
MVLQCRITIRHASSYTHWALLSTSYYGCFRPDLSLRDQDSSWHRAFGKFWEMEDQLIPHYLISHGR